jgi:hypothetical protein
VIALCCRELATAGDCGRTVTVWEMSVICSNPTKNAARCATQRYFLLNPNPSQEREQCEWHCLDLAAKRHGVIARAGCLISTHSHEIVTDVRGELERALAELIWPSMALYGKLWA